MNINIGHILLPGILFLNLLRQYLISHKSDLINFYMSH